MVKRVLLCADWLATGYGKMIIIITIIVVIILVHLVQLCPQLPAA